MNEQPVSIRNLNHFFGESRLRRQVLSDITAEVHPAEIVILTGPSGSGKTTLLTLIGALRSAQEGSLAVLGNELRGADETVLTATRRQIGYIFQSHNLLESLTAQQNVMAAMFEGSDKDVRATRALASEPRLILADEPTASLDWDTGRDVVERLRNLARSREVAVVLVTHDSRILDIADRILKLEDGRLSSFMHAVTVSTRRGFEMLVDSLQKGKLLRRLTSLDESEFRALMQQTAEETSSLLDLTQLLRGRTFDSVSGQIDAAFSARFARQIGAEQVVMYFLDPGGQTMHTNNDRSPVAANGSTGTTFDSTRGLPGPSFAMGQPQIVSDAQNESQFDPEVDGADTRSALLVPVRDASGAVFLVIQTRAPREAAFGSSERDELETLANSLGILLESWWRMGCACRSGGIGSESDCCNRLESPGE